MQKLMNMLALVFLIGLMPGCAPYEFDLTRPAELNRHVAQKVDTVVQRDPLEYRLRAVEGRLVMQIYNPTDDPITLLGPQSSVVDPDGQSHPLRTQSMAARSFVKVILPPMRPRIERGGPTFGIGLGVIGDARGRRAYRYDDIDYDEPRYLLIDDSDDAYYWDWKGETEVRISLSFDRAGKPFTQEFVFARKKAQ